MEAVPSQGVSPVRSAVVAGRDRTDRILLGILVGIAVAGGVALRFLPMTPLWLDEAQSAAIAAEGIDGLVEALRHDGHPPLYYLLLMGWSSVFGEGGVSLRALSGVLGVAAVGLTWVVARCHVDRRGAALAVAVIASSPFAIRYATEVRMYSLVLVLLLVGHVAVVAAWRRSDVRRLAGVAGVTAGLMFSHYWSVFLVAVMMIGLLVVASRGGSEQRRLGGLPGSLALARPRAVRLLMAIALGSLSFVVWLPVLLDQVAHTGTPWASSPRPTVVVALGLEAFGGGKGSEALLVAVLTSVLVVWGLGTLSDGVWSRVGWTHLSWLRIVAFVGGMTMLVGAVLSLAADSAFQGRYAVFCFVPVVLAAAVGLASLPGRAGLWVLAALLLLSSVSVARELTRDRTQLGVISETLITDATVGDRVVFCPDQLGPAGYRLFGNEFPTAAYPTLDDGRRVNWYDYEDRNYAADPSEFADRIVAWAEGSKHLWLVWIDGFRTFDGQCGALRSEFQQRLGGGATLVRADGDAYYNPANLVRFPGPGR